MSAALRLDPCYGSKSRHHTMLSFRCQCFLSHTATGARARGKTTGAWRVVQLQSIPKRNVTSKTARNKSVKLFLKNCLLPRNQIRMNRRQRPENLPRLNDNGEAAARSRSPGRKLLAQHLSAA